MVSIRDVAKRAGVAISTVSKVINNYPYVSEETKRKVRLAISELDYVPNTIAAALSSKQAGRAAVLIRMNTKTQAIDEITMQYLSGVLNKALELNIEIVTFFQSMIEHMSAQEVIRYLKSQGFSGILIFGMNSDDEYLKALINSQEFCCVVADQPFVNEKTSSIGIDQYKAQIDVARQTILENNCKRILYIAGKEGEYVTTKRLEAMNALKKELGLTMMVKYGDFSELMARELTFKYAKKKDIVVCASDLMAIGAMNALTEMDIFRPVCGFDGVTLMGYVGKQMNTVRQDFSFIAQGAVQELARLFAGAKGRRVTIPHELVKLYYKDIIR